MGGAPCHGLGMRGALLFTLALSACSAPSPHPTTVTIPPTESASPAPAVGATVRSAFCAYGGVGIVPDPLPPGYETTFVEHVFTIENPGPPLAGVLVESAGLTDPSGRVIAPVMRIEHVVDLTHEPPPDPSWGSFAVNLNPTGTPWAGTLPTGTSRLRVRYWIAPLGLRSPSHCRLELSGLGAPVTIEGPLDGALPTS
jgi:hypothetical protein